MKEMIFDNCGWMDENYRKKMLKDLPGSLIKGGEVGTVIEAWFDDNELHVLYDPREG